MELLNRYSKTFGSISRDQLRERSRREIKKNYHEASEAIQLIKLRFQQQVSDYNNNLINEHLFERR